MPDERVTILLDALGSGDPRAAEDLLPVVYDELRQVAAARMRKDAPGQTLQATALVHEAYVRLVGNDKHDYENRGHFFFAAARAMHQILVDRARQKAAVKNGGGRRRMSGDMLLVSAMETATEDMLALNDALQQLKSEDDRAYQLVMLRFFAGLTEVQAGEVFGVTERTVRRDWLLARTRLYQLMTDDESGANA